MTRSDLRWARCGVLPSPDIKQPYLDKVEGNRRDNAEAWDSWKVTVAEWERRTFEVKDRWCALNPFDTWVMPEDLGEGRGMSVPSLRLLSRLILVLVLVAVLVDVSWFLLFFLFLMLS